MPTPCHLTPEALDCPSCGCSGDTYVMTVEDMEDRGARFCVVDALTGIAWFSLPGISQRVAADVPLCGGCDAPIALSVATNNRKEAA